MRARCWGRHRSSLGARDDLVPQADLHPVAVWDTVARPVSLSATMLLSSPAVIVSTSASNILGEREVAPRWQMQIRTGELGDRGGMHGPGGVVLTPVVLALGIWAQLAAPLQVGAVNSKPGSMAADSCGVLSFRTMT